MERNEQQEIALVINATENTATITSNLEAVKRQLESRLAGFENKDFSDKKVAKATRATINKAYDALENERKRLHEIVERPYQEFLPLYNEAIARLVECKGFISAKCKELEDKEKPELPKKTLAYIVTIDVKQQQKLEEFLAKQSIPYRVKIKE